MTPSMADKIHTILEIHADLDLDAYGTAVVVGTDRQRCEDDTFDKITGIYSLNLTDDMLEAYKENNNQLLIIK